jgi:hypothetical protein
LSIACNTTLCSNCSLSINIFPKKRVIHFCSCVFYKWIKLKNEVYCVLYCAFAMQSLISLQVWQEISLYMQM